MKNKIAFLFFSFAMFFSTIVTAQIYLGGKTGVNMSQLTTQPKIEEFGAKASFAPKFGLEIGGVAYAKVSPYFSVQLEFDYTRKGFKSSLINYEFNNKIIDGESNYTYDYLEIPLLFKISLGTEGFNPFLEIGGYYGYMVYATQSSKFFIDDQLYLDNNKKKGFNSFTNNNALERNEYGFKIGIGGTVEVSKGLIFFNIRYTQGLTDITKTKTIDNKINNRVFQLGVGYVLELRSSNTNKIYYY